MIFAECLIYKNGRARINISVTEDKQSKIRITPDIEQYKSTDEKWIVVNASHAFYDKIGGEILRRQQLEMGGFSADN